MVALSNFDDDWECLSEVFPSMFDEVDKLGKDAFEVGWLIGCLQDVATCLIVAMTSYHPHAPETQQVDPFHILKMRYLRDLKPFEKEKAPEGIIEVIKLPELIEFVRMLREEDAEIRALDYFTNPRPLDRVDYDARIQTPEKKFADMIHDVLLDYYFLGYEDDEDIITMNEGWDAGRADPEIMKPWIQGPPTVYQPPGVARIIVDDHIQYHPDGTPMEYESAGEPIPSSAFSRPYTGERRPEGKCIICLEDMVDAAHGELVVARCTSGHVFHKECLDSWVNGSSMDNANTCPHDRERLCEPRDRRHMSDQMEEPVSSEEDEDMEESDEDEDMDDTDVYDSELDAEESDDDEMGMGGSA